MLSLRSSKYVLGNMNYVCNISLRIDTGDTSWYVMVALKGLFLKKCSRYMVMLMEMVL